MVEAEAVVEEAAAELAAEAVAEEIVEEAVEEAVAEEIVEEVVEEAVAEAETEAAVEYIEEAEEGDRKKPEIPGADLDVLVVAEDEAGTKKSSDDEFAAVAAQYEDDTEASAAETERAAEREQDELSSKPIASVAIDLESGITYRATGKRKSAIARVILKPGNGTHTVNGRTVEEYFPRDTLQRTVLESIEAVGLERNMDIQARLTGGGVSAQAGALRHGIARALLEADPGLRQELKRRGFLTRDPRVKERKKAGLKKARKKPQFSKR